MLGGHITYAQAAIGMARGISLLLTTILASLPGIRRVLVAIPVGAAAGEMGMANSIVVQ